MIGYLDHLVLTVGDIDATCDFYSRVLGMQIVTFGEGRKALQFGQQKINLHQYGAEFEPKSAHPMPGSADLCFITTIPLAEVLSHLHGMGITPETDIVERTGAMGKILSIYLRDPDHNLIELSNYSDV